VMTGESWSEVIARPLVFGSPGAPGYTCAGCSSVFVGFFFVSFLLLTQIVLVNVVVAVLLDKFVEEQPTGGKDEQPPDGTEGEMTPSPTSKRRKGGKGGEGSPERASHTSPLEMSTASVRVGSGGSGDELESAPAPSSAGRLEDVIDEVTSVRETMAGVVSRIDHLDAKVDALLAHFELALPPSPELLPANQGGGTPFFGSLFS
jgi:hypothetical protein